MRRFIILWILSIAILGSVSSLIWYQTVGLASIGPSQWHRMLSALFGVMVFTSFYIGIRWVRWHMLIRLFDVRLVAKESAAFYLATLPTLLTPFYIGELLRGVLLNQRIPGALRKLSVVWLIERGSDIVILSAFYFASQQQLIVCALLVIGFGGALLYTLQWGANMQWTRAISNIRLGALLIGTLSLLCWSIPVVSFLIAAKWLNLEIGPALAAETFSSGTLLGGISSLPLGTGVTGSLFIETLKQAGVDGILAAEFTTVFRAGTAWFSVCVGILAIILIKDRIFSLLRGNSEQGHFNELAPVYKENIPPHIRDRLIEKKSSIMQQHLPLSTRSLAGLDAGCGQGWYAVEMSKQGCNMVGIDLSFGQLAEAKEFSRAQKNRSLFCGATGSALPFADATFDFVYSINALHHVTDDHHRAAFLQEVVRVLKPGGVFFLHEMNTENPLFRFYLSYVFPLIKDIDDGTEKWIRPTQLPTVAGAEWRPEVLFYTFVPDFAPAFIVHLSRPFERYLEHSRWRIFSAHYTSLLVKKSDRNNVAIAADIE